MARVTKVYTFDASHCLPGHKGACARLHGHTYRVEVTFEGPIIFEPLASDDGMVTDFGDSLFVFAKTLISNLDHSHLNDLEDVRRPTAELIACWIFKRLWQMAAVENGPKLTSVKVWETPTSCAEVTYDDVFRLC